MQPIQFHIVWPGGNETAIVKTPVERGSQAAVANMILGQYSSVEQVGYLELPREGTADVHLQMMGGEFCGNAARSAAFLFCNQTGKQNVALTVSGFAGVVEASATAETAGISLSGKFIRRVQKCAEGVLVDLDGIRHIVVRKNFNPVQLIEQYKESFPAVGVITLQETQKGPSIDPLVWVRETNTSVHESGCGSGSIAAAICLQRKLPFQESFSILQPSGEAYEIVLQQKEGVTQRITLGGKVSLKGAYTLNSSVLAKV